MPPRIINFNAGPSTLPLEVLEQVREEMLDYRGCGMSILEISHRSPEYEEINRNTMSLIKSTLGLGDDYEVLLLTGGASTQFAMIPLNLMNDGQTAAYVDTGAWSSKAISEANKIGQTKVVASSKDKNYSYIPDLDDITLPEDTAYLHLTSNNTIFGTQIHEYPKNLSVPMICDMSSDICSRNLDYSKFSMIYAGSQKNLGPSGVTIIVVRKDLLEKCRDGNATMFDYRTHLSSNSLYNTPPVFSVYVMQKVLEWIGRNGGLSGIEKINRAKQERIYQLIDLYPDYYKGTVLPESRSWMNITFRLPSEELEKKFITAAKEKGMVGIKGHRSVGGVRVSLYNAQTIEGADTMAHFMDEFKKAN